MPVPLAPHATREFHLQVSDERLQAEPPAVKDHANVQVVWSCMSPPPACGTH